MKEELEKLLNKYETALVSFEQDRLCMKDAKSQQLIDSSVSIVREVLEDLKKIHSKFLAS